MTFRRAFAWCPYAVENLVASANWSKNVRGKDIPAFFELSWTRSPVETIATIENVRIESKLISQSTYSEFGS